MIFLLRLGGAYIIYFCEHFKWFLNLSQTIPKIQFEFSFKELRIYN